MPPTHRPDNAHHSHDGNTLNIPSAPKNARTPKRVVGKSIGWSFATTLSRFMTVKVITRVALVAVAVILLSVITEIGFAQKRAGSNNQTVKPNLTQPSYNGGADSASLTRPAVSPQDRLVPVIGKPIVPIRMDKDLRELPAVPYAHPGFEMPELRRHPRPETEESSAEEAPVAPFAALLQLLLPQPTMPALNLSFEGVDAVSGGCNCSPPDTDGDVGANHFIQMVNSGAFKIWNKSGSTLLATTSLNTLWGTGGSNPCTQGEHFGDGVVLYDHLADRWVLTDFAFGTSGPNTVAPYYQCTAVSKTSDPISGGWWLYPVQVDTTNTNWLGDYPKFGMWPDAYYSGYNMFCGASSCTFGGRNSFQGVQVTAYDRSKMILGQGMTPINFSLTPATLGDTYTLIPATYRFGTPPVGRNEFFASIDSPAVVNAFNTLTKVHIWKFDFDEVTPGNSTFTSTATDVTVSGFTNAWDSNENAAIVPQSGTAVKLDTVGDRLFANLWYQNLSGVESLWATHTINATSVAPTAVRWYQFNVTGNTVAGLPVQQGDINGGGDGLYRWMPSLSVDKSGNMAIGYSVSSSSTFPSIRYNGRLTTEPLNTLPQGESTMVSGTGAFTGSTRWGDYSAMSIDPVNGCTFWHTNEYMLSGSTSNWKTRIGSFAYAPCAGTGTLTGTVTDVSTSNPISGATVTAGSSMTTTNGSGVYTFSGITADTYSVTASATGYGSSTTTVTVSSGGTTTQNFALSPAVACGGANVWCSVTGTSGNIAWSVASTWDKGTAPAAGADVVIRPFSGAYSTANFVALNGSASVHSITIQTNANAGAGGSNGTQVFTVTGDFIIQSGGLLRDVLWMGAAQDWALKVGSNFTNDGTMGGISTTSKTNSGIEFNGTGAQVIGGTGGLRAMGGSGASGHSILFSNTSAGGVTLSANVNTTNSGGLTASVTINSSATVKFSSSSIQFTGGGSLALNGLTELQAATFNGHYAMTGTRTIATSSTITYKNTASTITPTTDIPSATIGNLIIDVGGGSATLGANLIISGNLTVNTGTFNLQSFTANRSASGGALSIVNGATLKIGGTNTFPTNYSTHTLGAVSTVEYSGTSQTVTNESYGNLTLSGSGTKTLPGTPMAIASNLTTSGTSSATAGAAITVSGNVTLGSGTTFTAGSFTHNVAGDWTNNGATFTPGTSTVNFNNTATGQTIGGTVVTQTFNNITVNKTAQTLSVGGSTTTLTLNGNLLVSTGAFTAPVTLNIAGNFTNNGVFNPNGGTARFNSSSAVQTIGGSTPTTFSTLTINNTASPNNTVTLGAATTVLTALNVTTGVFDQGASFSLTSNTVTVSSGATLKNLGTGGLTLSGDVANAGTITFNANGTVCGDADSILIRSSVNGTQRQWSGAGTFSMTDVNVKDQRTPVAPPPITIVVTSGTDSGNNTGWSFSGACTAGSYTWVGGINADWQVPTNWSPARAVPAAGDVLSLDGNATPGPIISNVPTQTIAALRLLNGVSVTLNASAVAPPQTLTINGATGADLAVPVFSQLTLAGTNGLTVNIGSGSTATIGGLLLFQDGPHRLTGNAANAITFQTDSICTTAPSYASAVNPFGSGAGAGNGFAGSVVFQSGSNYFHNNGASPFGALGNPSVVVFQTGSLATFLTATGFDGSGRTYGDLAIGQLDPGGVAVNASASGTGNFQFDNLAINAKGTTNSSLTFNGSGSSTITMQGNITSNGLGTAFQDVTLTAGAGGIVINKPGGGTITFGNDGSNSRGMDFEGSGNVATVTNGTTLTLSRVLLLGLSNPHLQTLTVNATGNITGSSSGFVVGSLKKTSVPSGSFIFPVGTVGAYSPLDLANSSGGGDLTVAARTPQQPVLVSGTSLQRYWTLTKAGSLTTDLTFHYNDPLDVAGNEANYRVVVVESGNATSFPADANHSVDMSANTFNIKQVQNFSDWTVAEPNAPTAVKLQSFTATRDNNEVMLQWRTGYEARNLGYNIYREQDGKRTQITPSLVAGSALIAGRQAKLTAGLSYTWYDEIPTADGRQQTADEIPTADGGQQTAAVGGQRSAVTYWLEDVDLNGTRTLHGPIAPTVVYAVPQPGGKALRADLISEMGERVSQRTAPSGVQFNGWAGDGAERQSGPQAGMKSASGPVIDPIDMQHQLAGMAGVKLAVGKAGWYRVTQAELQAAGFKVGNVGNLQLFRNGRELAIGVSGNGQGFGAGDYVEFYGAGLESATETAQSYYLVNGSTRGKRLSVTKGGKASAPAGPQSFAYTIERKERMIYFSSLRNGDTENFFGQIVSSTAVTAAMPVSHLEAATGGAQLQVVLQGVTSQSHLVQVLLNGTDLGTINFANLEHPNQTFAVPAGALHDGDNTVALSSLGGAADVSLVDVLRLTYTRSLVADNNTLSLGINSQQTRRITGFTNQNVRVLDITDPNNTTELTPVVKAEDGGYAAYVEVGQASGLAPHTLLALAAAGGPAASVKANNPSSWWSQAGGTGGADYLIVTTGELKASVEPLAQLRRNQGMVVQVIDVEDLYDEFSYGTHTPQAIHDLLQTATSSWTRKPHYVLLAGDASYDPKNYFGQGLNDLVPTKLLDTALMETASDDWLADFNGDGLADLALGRLPMRTAADLNTMVGKLVSYETAAVDPTRGAVLVADTSFEGSSSAVGSLLPSGMPVTTINRSSADDATIHNQIIAGLNQGPRVANYVGHGSNGVWTGASLLSSDDAPALTNTNRLSVFTMMTCFNGFFQDAYNDSLAEALLKSPGGAVAVWASTTLTDPEGQNVIDQEFYRLLFGAQPLTLGDASRAAKGATGDADVRRTWTLFGDPAMRLR